MSRKKFLGESLKVSSLGTAKIGRLNFYGLRFYSLQLSGKIQAGLLKPPLCLRSARWIWPPPAVWPAAPLRSHGSNASEFRRGAIVQVGCSEKEYTALTSCNAVYSFYKCSRQCPEKSLGKSLEVWNSKSGSLQQQKLAVFNFYSRLGRIKRPG